MVQRTCTLCKVTKSEDEYYRLKSRNGGPGSWCKECSKAKRRRHYAENREQTLQRNREYRQANPEVVLERSRRYDEAHPENARARKKRWNDEHSAERARLERIRQPEVVRARQRKWADANRDKIAAKHQRWKLLPGSREKMAERARRRYAAKRRNGVARITAKLLEQKMAYWGRRCWMCGGQFEHVDHVKPIAKGGAHFLCNLRPACGPCNQAKNGRWPWPTSRSSFPGGAGAYIASLPADTWSAGTTSATRHGRSSSRRMARVRAKCG